MPAPDNQTEFLQQDYGAYVYETPLKAASFGIGGDRTEHVLWPQQHGNFDGQAKLDELMT